MKNKRTRGQEKMKPTSASVRGRYFQRRIPDDKIKPFLVRRCASLDECCAAGGMCLFHQEQDYQ